MAGFSNLAQLWAAACSVRIQCVICVSCDAYMLPAFRPVRTHSFHRSDLNQFRSSTTASLYTVLDFLCELDKKPHILNDIRMAENEKRCPTKMQSFSGFSENHNFFTMSCHCQTTKFSTDPTKIVLLKNKSFQKKHHKSWSPTLISLITVEVGINV